MNLWIEKGELRSDDDGCQFMALSLGHDLYTYAFPGVLLAMICHGRFEPQGEWRLPTDDEKEKYSRRLHIDPGSVLAYGVWKPLETR